MTSQLDKDEYTYDHIALARIRKDPEFAQSVLNRNRQLIAENMRLQGVSECLERYNSHIVPVLLSAVKSGKSIEDIPVKAIEYAMCLTEQALKGEKS